DSVATVTRPGAKLLVGLSGTPSACSSGFKLFVRPGPGMMVKTERVFAPVIDADIAEDFTNPNPFTSFILTDIKYIDSKAYAKPSGFNKSNAVTSIAKSNGVIVMPGGTRGFEKGDAVKVMMTDVTSGSDNFGVE